MSISIIEEKAMESILSINHKIPKITLRDYFAGQVLSGMGRYLIENREDLNKVAESCYKIADAMLEYSELKK